MMNNWFGGDHPDKKIHMPCIKNHFNIHTSQYERAGRQMVDPQNNKASFEYYESMVKTMESILNQEIEERI